jgi:hypothetical protein
VRNGLYAFVSVAKSAVCKRSFRIYRIVLPGRDLGGLKSPPRSTHVLTKTRYLALRFADRRGRRRLGRSELKRFLTQSDLPEALGKQCRRWLGRLPPPFSGFCRLFDSIRDRIQCRSDCRSRLLGTSLWRTVGRPATTFRKNAMGNGCNILPLD